MSAAVRRYHGPISFVILMFIQDDGRKTRWVLFLIGYYWLMTILRGIMINHLKLLFVLAVLYGSRRQDVL